MSKKKAPPEQVGVNVKIEPPREPTMVNDPSIQGFIDQLSGERAAQKPSDPNACLLCGRGTNLSEEDVRSMSRDDFIVAAREHHPDCDFIATYVRPWLDKARNLRSV